MSAIIAHMTTRIALYVYGGIDYENSKMHQM